MGYNKWCTVCTIIGYNNHLPPFDKTEIHLKVFKYHNLILYYSFEEIRISTQKWIFQKAYWVLCQQSGKAWFEVVNVYVQNPLVSAVCIAYTICNCRRGWFAYGYDLRWCGDSIFYNDYQDARNHLLMTVQWTKIPGCLKTFRNTTQVSFMHVYMQPRVCIDYRAVLCILFRSTITRPI